MTIQLHVIEHPLVEHKLTVLRDKTTPSKVFRELIGEIVTLEAYEATRNLLTVPREIETPVAPMIGQKVNMDPRVLVIPVLRAGLGMLDGMMHLLPTADVGFLGMKRDEETLDIITYANRLPEDLSGRQCFILDPMLATGGTLVTAIKYLHDAGARHITAICIIAAPEGIDRLRDSIGDDIDFTLVVAHIDERLNERGYIVPGLGDAGDRLYGSVD